MSARKQRRQLYTATPQRSGLLASWAAPKGLQQPVKQERGKHGLKDSPRGPGSAGVEACRRLPGGNAALGFWGSRADCIFNVGCVCLKLSGAPRRSRTGSLLLLAPNSLAQKSPRHRKGTSSLQPRRRTWLLTRFCGVKGRWAPGHRRWEEGLPRVYGAAGHLQSAHAYGSSGKPCRSPE